MDHLQAVDSLATERYLLGEMTEPERDAFEEHYFDCGACAEDVRIGSLMSDAARAGLLNESRVATFAPRPRASQRWRHSVALPWAVAATLVVGIAYQSIGMGPASRRQSGPQALTPVTLRPASRGQETMVAMPSRGGAVTLAIDIPPSNPGIPDPGAAGPGTPLSYELRRADGAIVASGQLPAPPPGSPLLLWVPADRLSGSEHYVLTIRDRSTASLTGNDYRFIVQAP